MQKVATQAVLIGLLAGCSAAGNSRSALTFVPGDDFIEAFRGAAARIEKATGLLAIEDTQGRSIRWGRVEGGPADAGTCMTDMETENGLRVPKAIVCDENSRWLMEHRDVAELIILHELGHAFNPGTAINPRHDHPEDGNVMFWNPPNDACLTEVDLTYFCGMGACSKFEPECWID